jgi:hypothetical protein
MYENDFIPLEQTKEMYKLGFNDPCFTIGAIITRKECSKEANGSCGEHNYFSNKCRFPLCIIGEEFHPPTYSQAFRWFKKTHNLKFYIREDIWNHWCDVKVLRGQEYYSVDSYDSYEKAELALLIELIRIVKIKKNEDNN